MLNRTLLVAVILLAAYLRLFRLDAQSFWNDEGNSARIAERSFGLIAAGAAGDIHPPGYYVLLAGWRRAAGQSEFALRGLSALAGVALVALVYPLGRRYFGAPAALGAALLAAVHPALIYYSQEARMYSLASALAAASWLLAEATTGWALAAGGRFSRRAWRYPVGLSVCLAAGLYTHYAFAFVVVAINLYFITLMARRFLAHRNVQAASAAIFFWLAAQALALALFLPWLPTALRQIAAWPAERSAASFVDALLGASAWLAFGPGLDDQRALVFLLAPAGALLAGVAWQRARALAALAWLGVPLGLALGFGLFSKTFAKLLIVSVPAVCLLLGAALALRPRWLRLVLVLHVLATGLALSNLYFNPAYARADYRGIAGYLDSVARPRDAILLNAPNQWEVFTYYHPDTSNVFPLARARPFDVPAQIAELEALAAGHDRLFVIYWGEAQADPNRVIESWLNENTFKAYDRWFADVRLAAYAVPRAATDLQTRTDVVLGDRIVLDGYSLSAATLAPGDILQLTLFWRAEAPVANRYKVFVHLVDDPSLPPVAQHDGEPGGGLVLTTTWEPGARIRDNHGVFLPLDLPPGNYALLVGMYGLEDGVRLAHAEGETIHLTTITVKP